jgi:hypothetical protein
MARDHVVEIVLGDRPGGWYVAACTCGEHAESQHSAILEAWVTFHRTEATALAHAGVAHTGAG